jgi:hypothetical protein
MKLLKGSRLFYHNERRAWFLLFLSSILIVSRFMIIYKDIGSRGPWWFISNSGLILLVSLLLGMRSILELSKRHQPALVVDPEGVTGYFGFISWSDIETILLQKRKIFACHCVKIALRRPLAVREKTVAQRFLIFAKNFTRKSLIITDGLAARPEEVFEAIAPFATAHNVTIITR